MRSQTGVREREKNEFVSDPRLNGLGGLALEAPAIWFSPFRLTPVERNGKHLGVFNN